jgi:hypothetical protein
MSDTNANPAEPTENQPGGSTAAQPAPDPINVDDPQAVAPAEPTENQPGGSQ